MSNEAAERLLTADMLSLWYAWGEVVCVRTSDGSPRISTLAPILAAERKATVERIRAALEEHDPEWAGYRIWAILDAEAAR